MRYPLISYPIQESVAISIPDPTQVRTVYESLRSENESIAFPYWAQIWPSAKAMLAFLEEHSFYVANKRVVELGAGIALPSLWMASQMAELVISDYDEDAVTLMEKNIEHLQLKNTVARNIDWNEFPNDLEMDVLLLCDVNYDPNQFEGLLHLMRNMLNRGVCLILATPQRITASAFVEALSSWIKQTEVYTIEHSGADVDISILILSA